MIHSSFLCLCALESSFITKTGDLVQFGCFYMGEIYLYLFTASRHNRMLP